MTTPADTIQRPKIQAGIKRHGKTAKYTRAADSAVYTVKITPPAPAKQADREMYEAEIATALADYELGFTPARFDKVKIDDVVWMVVLASPRYTGEQVGFWDLLLRS